MAYPNERMPRMELRENGPDSYDVFIRGRYVGRIDRYDDLPRTDGHTWKAIPLRESHHAYPAGIGTGRTAWEAAQAFLR